MGRAHRSEDAAAGGRRTGCLRQQPGLHQHPGTVGNLVSGIARSAAGLGRADRVAPQLTVPRDPRLGRASVEGRQAESRGLHLEPGSGRGLFTGGTGPADRLGQRCSATDATRRTLRSRAGAHFAGDAGADPQPGTDRSRCRRRRRGATTHRTASVAAQTAGCAGAASGQHGAGRWLYTRRAVRRSAWCLGLS